MGCGTPFLYSTNGEIIWFHDVHYQASRSRQIADFHTPAALREMLARLQRPMRGTEVTAQQQRQTPPVPA